ncbi:MAG TPA: hypothetical protein VGH13_11370 [Xanthobacteraceae bacterium]
MILEIDKHEVVKGYEYSRGQFLTFTAEELKALDVEKLKGCRPGEICGGQRQRSDLF